MATAPVGLAPGLTPHTLGVLADILEQDHLPEQAEALRKLLPFVEALVRRCFVPLFKQPRENDFLSNFNRLSADYGAYRLLLHQIFSEVLNKLTNQNFAEFYEHKLFEILSALLMTAREMEMGPQLISAMIRDYITIIKIIPVAHQPSGAPDAQKSELSAQQCTEIFNLIHAAARFDYSLTAVLLVLEKSLPIADRMDKWALLSASKGALVDFGEAVSRILVQERMPSALPQLESAYLDITIAGSGVLTTSMPVVSRPKHVGQASPRAAEMNWLTNHKDVADRYGGQWIVLEKEELIANDADYQKARDAATQQGIKRPFIIFIPPRDSGAFMGI